MKKTILVLSAMLFASGLAHASAPERAKCVPHVRCAEWKARLPGLKQASEDAKAAEKNQDKSCRKDESAAACKKRVAEEAGKLAGDRGFADGSRDAVKANIDDYCCN